MKRYVLKIFLIVVTLSSSSLLTGCSSGRVGRALLSQDGNILAFRDAHWLHEAIYLAGKRGIQKIGNADFFLLSADGRRLLLINRGSSYGGGLILRADDFLTLVEVAGDKRYATRLPFDIPRSSSNPGLPQSSDSQIVKKVTENDYEENRLAGLQVFFDQEPVRSGDLHSVGHTFSRSILMIGSIGGEYWRWNIGGDWEQIPCPAPKTYPLGTPSSALQEQRRYLVQLAPTGLIARRTIWVRPDGSELELVRQNDAPLRACLVTVLAPFLLNPFGAAQILSSLSDPPNPQDVPPADLEQRKTERQSKKLDKRPMSPRIAPPLQP